MSNIGAITANEKLEGAINSEQSLEGNVGIALGLTPQIVIGTVTTLEEGQDVYVKLDGTSTRLRSVFNFGIPRGSQGLKGDKGDKGDTGETAYASAQKGGYVGTIEEFYTSLASIGNINAVLDGINGEVV